MTTNVNELERLRRWCAANADDPNAQTPIKRSLAEYMLWRIDRNSPPATVYRPRTTLEQRQKLAGVITTLDPSLGYYGIELVLEDLRNAEAALGEKW